jgi:serine/threonine-protein kinase
MEHLEGESLTRRSARTPFRWPAALAIARQIAGALAAAHAKGIVHRDLKPDNVFLVPDPDVPGGERIKLLDFGIAKLVVASSTSHSVTRTGAVIGTPMYMSPEQCRGVAVDHRADLYALGCVIYELCCGRPPFVGEGAGDVLAAHILLPAPAMSNTNAEIPQIVEALVRRLLAKEPGARLQTADKVILAIDALTSEQAPATIQAPAAPAATAQLVTGSAMTTLSGSAVMTAPQRRTARLLWSVAAVAAFVAAIATAIVIIGVHRDDAAVAAAPAAAGPAQTAALVVAARPDEPRDEPRDALPRPVAQAPAPPAAHPQPDEPPAKPAVQTPRDEPPRPVAQAPAPPAVHTPRDEPPRPVAQAPAPPAAHTQPDQPPAKPARPAAPPAQQAAPPARPAALPTLIDVFVDSAPSGAEVLLGGAVQGTTPFVGRLPRGDRDLKLVIRLAGYVDGTLLVRPTTPIRELVTLAHKPAAAVPKRPTPERDRSVNPFD